MVSVSVGASEGGRLDCRLSTRFGRGDWEPSRVCDQSQLVAALKKVSVLGLVKVSGKPRMDQKSVHITTV